MLPPGPSSSALLQTLAWVRRPVRLMTSCRAAYGPTFRLRFVGGRDFVFVTRPEHVREVFTADPDLLLAGRANAAFARFMGRHSLFALDGPEHRRHRRLLVPPFAGERMRAYGPLLVALTRRHVARWPRGRPLSLAAALQALTLDAIFEAVFGVTDPATMARLTGLVARLTGRASALLAFVPFLRLDLGPWSPWGRFVRCRAELDAILLDAIARARRAGGEDILARLIAESEARGEPLTDEELRDELLTLLGAGHETTATGLAWTLVRLLAAPAALARVTDELREVVGGADPSAEHLPRLPFLDAVVQEALRLDPPVPIAVRQLAAPARVAGHDLPADTRVAPCIWLAQRDPEVFPDPHAFRPERFLGGRPPPRSFFPFGGGARVCIGMAFALFEMKLILATLLQAVRLRPAAPFTGRAARHAIVLTPAGGAPVTLEDR
ncbi:MAG: cytochrome P450 [Planctomycetes bacterium]|nr:cytochrome P450 [Planctomycetota bacterium]